MCLPSGPNYNSVVKKGRVATRFFGSTMDRRIDDKADRRIYFFGVWEPNLTHFMKPTIKEGDIIVDVGAHPLKLGDLPAALDRCRPAAMALVGHRTARALSPAAHAFQYARRLFQL